MKDNWWKFLVLAVVVIGLVWWRQNQAPREELEVPTPEEQLEQQVNQFLEDSGIRLPEGSERANLSDQTGGSATGVASRQVGTTRTDITVIADLPDLTGGSYVAWLTDEDGDFERMGALRPAKGGYLIDFSTSQNIEGMDEVVISRETSITNQPSELILQGSF
jgi:hypothetical protein